MITATILRDQSSSIKTAPKQSLHQNNITKTSPKHHCNHPKWHKNSTKTTSAKTAKNATKMAPKYQPKWHQSFNALYLHHQPLHHQSLMHFATWREFQQKNYIRITSTKTTEKVDHQSKQGTCSNSITTTGLVSCNTLMCYYSLDIVLLKRAVTRFCMCSCRLCYQVVSIVAHKHCSYMYLQVLQLYCCNTSHMCYRRPW